ncbi:MAG: filamentous hemagglutinin N-terminal domain-containing protein [Symploca sp. SIO1C2]|nr:filamentous hemagglutinin N-terminal domain-containing protein [Symploca sp. SIO1C2]
MSLLLNDDQYHQVSLSNLATHLGDIFSYDADSKHITKASLTSTQRKKQDPKNIPQEKWRLGLAKYAFSMALGFGSAIAFSGNCALAQVIPDNSLGTQVDPNLAITGGTTVGGTNLFHSFSSFSVPDGAVADFQNATNIVNIFSRVTGGVQSDILGTIQAQGNANFFLLNPSGIAFGPNAELRIGGSFVGTTADGIRFPNGGEFSLTSAVAPNNQLLTVNPSALFFNQTPTGAITNQSTVGLEVGTGQNLFLVGGNVNFDGGVVRAPGGRIELGGLAAPGTIAIEDNPEGSNPSLTFPDVRLTFPDDVAKADVLIDNSAIVDVVGNDGGDIFINAGNITVSGGSNICAGIGADASSCDTPGFGSGGVGSEAGNILFNATGAVSIRQSRIENNVNPGATGNSLRNIFEALDNDELFGSILISAGSFSLTDGATLSTSTFGQGSAGVVFVDSDDLVLVNNSRIFSNVESGGVGDAGGVLIIGDSLSVFDGILTASTLGLGDAGLVAVEATGSVTLAGQNTGMFSAVGTDAQGEALGIVIEAGSFSMTDGAQLNVSTLGLGDAGLVAIETTGSVFLGGQNTGIFSAVGTDAQGDALGIVIEAGSFAMTDSAQLNANTFGLGDAGDMVIEAGSVSMTSGATITTQTFGEGSGGIILIQSEGAVSMTGSGTLVTSNVESTATGNTIGIRIDARSLFMDGGAELQALTRGDGNAGVILINAADFVELSGVSPTEGFSTGLFTSTEDTATGPGGFIIVNTDNLRLSDGAVLSARTRNSFQGGDILVTVNNLEVINGGQILTTAFENGRAGRILVIARDRITLSGRDANFRERFLQTLARSIDQFGPVQGPSIALQIFDNVAPGSSGIFANASAGSTAEGGGIFVFSPELFIQDGATITVNNQGTGPAGDLFILARDLFLNNEGTITAETASGQGGNITLGGVELLLLLRNSQISTRAGQPPNGGNGGNIDIDTRFVLSAPGNDSNIRANAFDGDGGNISISASRLFDIEEREDVLTTNDITASSEFGRDGVVTTNVANIDPTSGFTDLPTNLVDPTTLIAETCPTRSSIAEREKNQFIITGQGGLPPDPNAAFPGEAVVNDWEATSEEVEESIEDSSNVSPTAVATSPTPSPNLIEAQGWIYGENGEIIFTAQAPNVTPTTLVLNSSSTCNAN